MHCLNSSSTAVRAVAAARWWSSSSGGGSFFSLWRRSSSRFGPFNKSKFVGSARGVPPLPTIEQLPPGTEMADASARYQQVRWKHLGSEYVRFIMMTLVLSSRQFFRNTITIVIIFIFIFFPFFNPVPAVNVVLGLHLLLSLSSLFPSFLS